MPGRTDQQCMGRWKRHLDPSIRRDSWSPEEDGQLCQLAEDHDNGWSAVSRALTGRTPQQCRTRWHYLQSNPAAFKAAQRALEDMRVAAEAAEAANVVVKKRRGRPSKASLAVAAAGGAPPVPTPPAPAAGEIVGKKRGPTGRRPGRPSRKKVAAVEVLDEYYDDDGDEMMTNAWEDQEYQSDRHIDNRNGSFVRRGGVIAPGARRAPVRPLPRSGGVMADMSEGEEAYPSSDEEAGRNIDDSEDEEYVPGGAKHAQHRGNRPRQSTGRRTAPRSPPPAAGYAQQGRQTHVPEPPAYARHHHQHHQQQQQRYHQQEDIAAEYSSPDAMDITVAMAMVRALEYAAQRSPAGAQAHLAAAPVENEREAQPPPAQPRDPRFNTMESLVITNNEPRVTNHADEPPLVQETITNHSNGNGSEQNAAHEMPTTTAPAVSQHAQQAVEETQPPAGAVAQHTSPPAEHAAGGVPHPHSQHQATQQDDQHHQQEEEVEPGDHFQSGRGTYAFTDVDMDRDDPPLLHGSSRAEARLSLGEAPLSPAFFSPALTPPWTRRKLPNPARLAAFGPASVPEEAHSGGTDVSAPPNGVLSTPHSSPGPYGTPPFSARHHGSAGRNNGPLPSPGILDLLQSPQRTGPRGGKRGLDFDGVNDEDFQPSPPPPQFSGLVTPEWARAAAKVSALAEDEEVRRRSSISSVARRLDIDNVRAALFTTLAAKEEDAANRRESLLSRRESILTTGGADASRNIALGKGSAAGNNNSSPMEFAPLGCVDALTLLTNEPSMVPRSGTGISPGGTDSDMATRGARSPTFSPAGPPSGPAAATPSLFPMGNGMSGAQHGTILLPEPTSQGRAFLAATLQRTVGTGLMPPPVTFFPTVPHGVVQGTADVLREDSMGPGSNTTVKVGGAAVLPVPKPVGGINGWHGVPAAPAAGVLTQHGAGNVYPVGIGPATLAAFGIAPAQPKQPADTPMSSSDVRMTLHALLEKV